MLRFHHAIVDIVVLFLMAVSSAKAQVPAAETLLADVGYSADEIAKVKAGTIVDKKIPGANERDLAAAFAFFVGVPPSELVKDLRSGLMLEVDPNTIAFGPMSAAGSDGDMAKMTLTPGADKRVKRYLRAKGGDDLNLSTDEIAAFNKLGAAAAAPAVESQVRSALLARYQAYQSKGLAGIADYDRGDGKTRAVGDELKTSLQAFKALQKYAPGAYTAMLEYPNSKPAGATDGTRWMHFNAHDVPTLALVHGMFIPEGDGFVALQRQFYVSEGYNCEQAVAAFLPVQGGTVVLYANHTSSDQVQGAMGGMKRSIGSKMLSSQLQSLFASIQKKAK